MNEFEKAQLSEDEIDIRQLLQILRKHMKWILIITTVMLVASGLISFYVLSPIYEASTSLMVSKTYSENELITQLQLNDINLNARLAENYSKIIKSRRVMEIVIEDMGLDISYEGLQAITGVELVKNTEFFNITVQNEDPKLAMDIANKLAMTFKEEVAKIMKVENVTVLDSAVLPEKPVKPNKRLNVAIAGILGLMLSIGLAFLLEFLDRTIKTPDDVKRYLGLTAIGAIPKTQNGDIKDIASRDPKSPITEAYRTLRTNIQFASLDNPIKTIMTSSSIAGEGKSSTTFNLATVFAQTGAKVLVVDGDFRKPKIHRLAKMPNVNGLSDILINQSDYKESIVKSWNENMDLLFSGTIPPNPSELLNSKRMEKLIATLKEDYDYVFFDTPPVAIVTDAAILSTKIDGMILVSAVGEVEFSVAMRAVELLRNVNANILGSVLNKIPIQDKSYSYYYYASYYGEFDSKKKKKRKKKEKVNHD